MTRLIQFLFVIVPLLALSQNTLFDMSNSELPEEDLLSVAVDTSGNRWIGTEYKGLVMFGGGEFVSFNKESLPEIKGDHVSPVFVDSKDRVWVSYAKPEVGIAMLEGNTWTNFSSIEVGTNSIIAICEDSQGVVYFGGAKGVVFYKEGEWWDLELPEGKFFIRDMDFSSSGTIAIGHDKGLLVSEKGKWKSYTEENSELKLGTVRAVKFDGKGKLYIGYGGGFGSLDKGGFSILENDTWKHYNKSNSDVPDLMVRDIEIDAKGVLWMATNNGVIQMEGDVITPHFFREGKFMNVISDIAIEEYAVWVATNFGLIRINRYFR